MSQAQTFLNLINQLEQLLKTYNNSTKHLGARRLVENASQDHELINHYKLDLIEYLELRNAIVHKTTGKAIAEPHQEVIDHLQHILNQLQHPPRALDIAASPVYTCSTKDLLLDVITVMSGNSYTVVPIYHDQRFVGVFSDQTLTQWLAQQQGRVDLDTILISQLQDHFSREDDQFNSYHFIDDQTDVFAVRKAFVSFTEEKKRLGAIFITKHGQPDEDISGIITAWDLPKISSMSL